ncbi:MAG: hypothetical protein ABFD51_00595 [Anaerolineaceae bacterium]
MVTNIEESKKNNEEDVRASLNAMLEKQRASFLITSGATAEERIDRLSRGVAMFEKYDQDLV